MLVPFQEAATETAGLSRLCTALKDELGALGVCISTTVDGSLVGTLASSNTSHPAVEELQFAAGEGPTYRALETGLPVLVHRLEERFIEWPGYVSAALEAGAGAVFALPLRQSGVTLAALTTYARGPLTGEELRWVVDYADAATHALLREVDDRVPGAAESPVRLPAGQARIYQAQGMLMAELGVGGQEALVRMRGESFRTGRSLADTARDILNRDSAASQ